MDNIRNLLSPDYVSRLFKKKYLKSFGDELRQLMPDSRTAARCKAEQITDLLTKHKLSSDCNEVRVGAQTILQMCTTNCKFEDFSENIFPQFTEKFISLGVARTTVDNAIYAARRRVFRELYEIARSTGPLRGNRRSEFFAEASKLGLSNDSMQVLINQAIKVEFDVKMAAVLKDPIISPDFERELEEMAEDAGVKLALADDETNRIFEIGRVRWRIKNGQLPIVDSPAMLKRGESCHANTAAELYEFRVKNGQRSGVHVAIGLLVVTDKRLLFTGNNKAMSIAWETIVDWELFSDGIEVRRSSGKPVIFTYGTGNKVFSEILICARGKFVN